MLPQEMGCGSAMSCWRRLREWQEAGVWERLHQVVLERLSAEDQLDWERASLDTASVPAPGGPSDRAESNEAPCCGRTPRHPSGRKAYGCQRT